MVPEFILNNVAPAGIELGKNLLTAYTERGIDAGTGKLWLELKKKKSEMRDAEAELYDTIEYIVKKHCKQAETETMLPQPNDSSVAYISEMILKSWSDNGYIDDVTYQMIERYTNEVPLRTASKEVLNTELTSAVLNNYVIRTYLWNNNLLSIRKDLQENKREQERIRSSISEQEREVKKIFEIGKKEIINELTKPKVTNILFFVSGLIEIIFLIGSYTTLSADLDIIKSQSGNEPVHNSIVPVIYICFVLINIIVKILCGRVLDKNINEIISALSKNINHYYEELSRLLDRKYNFSIHEITISHFNGWSNELDIIKDSVMNYLPLILTFSGILDLVVSIMGVVTVVILYHLYGCSVFLTGTISAKIALVFIICNAILFIVAFLHTKNIKIVEKSLDKINYKNFFSDENIEETKLYRDSYESD